MEEKIIDGLIIKYNKLTIAHNEPVLNLGNRRNLKNKVYPIKVEIPPTLTPSYQGALTP